MANIIRTGDPHGFNKGCSSMFCVGSRVWQTPEEGWRTYWSKHCGNNNKDEDNSSKTLNDKNHQASSQKFRQLSDNWKKKKKKRKKTCQIVDCHPSWLQSNNKRKWKETST